MKFRLPGATALAALLVAVAAPAPLAFAQNGAQPSVQVSRDIVQPLNEARAALTAKDWATAKTKLDAATAKAKTPADKGQIDRLRFYLGSQTKDGAAQIAAINALVAGGTLTPEETKQYKSALAAAHAEAGDAVASRNAAKAYIDEYGGTPDQMISMANEFYKANDNANTVTYATKAITAIKATGKPDESWYRLLASAHSRLGQAAEVRTVREQHLSDYPMSQNAEQYWKELIVPAQEAPGYGPGVRLDLFRTLQAAGVKLNAQERTSLSDGALKRGLPNEAFTVLESAVAANDATLTALDKENFAEAKTQIVSDKAGLAKEAADAQAKGTGADMASIGEAYLSYGDNAKAVELLKAAIAKGIADAGELDAAKLHLGIAQYRAGDKDAARATWAEVKADTAPGILASNWTLISKIK